MRGQGETALGRRLGQWSQKVVVIRLPGQGCPRVRDVPDLGQNLLRSDPQG
jgi:hypothetical protein